MWLAACAWKWGWEVTHQAFDVLYMRHTSVHFYYSFNFSLLFLLPLSFPSYTYLLLCLSLSLPLSLTASFLLFFSSSLSSTPCIPPSMPSLCLFDILPPCRLALSVLLVCHPPSLLSSLVSPFSQSLSSHFFFFFFVLSALTLKHWIDNSGAALQPVDKKSKIKFIFNSLSCTVRGRTLHSTVHYECKNNLSPHAAQDALTYRGHYHNDSPSKSKLERFWRLCDAC